MVVVRVAVVDYIGSTQLSVDNRAFSLHFVDQVFSTCQRKTTIIYLKMAPHGIWSISVQYNVCRMLELAVWKSGIYANAVVVVSWALTLYKHGRTHAHFHTMFTVCKAGWLHDNIKVVGSVNAMVSFRFSALFHIFFARQILSVETLLGFLHLPAFPCLPSMQREYQTNAYLSLVSKQTKRSRNKQTQ